MNPYDAVFYLLQGAGWMLLALYVFADGPDVYTVAAIGIFATAMALNTVAYMTGRWP